MLVTKHSSRVSASEGECGLDVGPSAADVLLFGFLYRSAHVEAGAVARRFDRRGLVLAFGVAALFAACVEDAEFWLCDPDQAPAALSIHGGEDRGTWWEGSLTRTVTEGGQFEDDYVLELDVDGVPTWLRPVWVEDERDEFRPDRRMVSPSFGCERTDQFALYMGGTNGQVSVSAKSGPSWKSRVMSVVSTRDYLGVSYATGREAVLLELEKVGTERLRVTWFFADIDPDSDSRRTSHIRGVVERVEVGR